MNIRKFTDKFNLESSLVHLRKAGCKRQNEKEREGKVCEMYQMKLKED